MANAANKDISEMSRKAATIFDCSICLDEFKNPKYLPCLHTYCETCLQAYIESTAKTDDRKTSFACPVCRLPVTLPDSSNYTFGTIASQLPFNHLIFSLMTDSKSKNKVSYSCDPCARVGDDVKAMHWCQQCNELLCSPCLKSFHNRLKDSGKHKVLAISEGHKIPKLPDDEVNEPCDAHTGKLYEVFCLDHSEMCCIICLAVNHRECRNIKPIEEVIELCMENKIEVAVIKDLNCIKRQITELIKNKRYQIVRLSAEKERIISESECSINKVIAKLEKLKSEIKANVSNTCLSKVTPIQEQIDIFSGFDENISQNERFLTTVTDHGKDKQVFLTLQKIKKTLHFQRKTFEEAAENDETDNSIFELMLDQSLTNILMNKEIPFDLNTKQIKGWKGNSKTEIIKHLDKIAERFDGIRSLNNRSQSKYTKQTDTNLQEEKNPDHTSVKSNQTEAAGFAHEALFENEDGILQIFEGNDQSASSEEEQDSLNLHDRSMKTISRRHSNQDRRRGKREKRRFQDKNKH
ncbi:E3 ubiquitin-protein ligase TRIM56-like [Mytilus trossulus]|uniref:E3 ubiquitin-protein ligase TRIM56-like n=1 Tax=Mytilus trossulus TaxID=6551 RepID=UPI003004C03F